MINFRTREHDMEYIKSSSIPNYEELETEFEDLFATKECGTYIQAGRMIINKKDNDKTLLISTTDQTPDVITNRPQEDDSIFGKIISINMNDNPFLIYSKGHRNIQGLYSDNNVIIATEHGPRGGDEINNIIKNKNYGWPIVSYGVKYLHDKDKKSYEVNHENNKFEEPLFALVPSVGISAINNCPAKLNKYYKKPCLLALSLYGNVLRRGRSIIIYLLNDKMDKVHSVEQIHLRDDLKLRHFVTNNKNEIYEDKEGSIYISADKKGIYKLSFTHFRKRN